MHENDPNDTGRDDGLTDAERAELDADTASNGAPTGAAATPALAATPEPVEAKPEPTPEPEAKVDPTTQVLAQLVEQQSATAAALDAVAKAVAPKSEPAVDPTPAAPAEPDWEGEKKALRAKYEANELDDDAYEQAREALLERKTEHRAQQLASKAVEERFAKDQADREAQAKKDADARWDSAVGTWMQDAGNAALFGDQAKATTFNALLAAVAKEKPNLAYADLLNETRDRTLRAFGQTVAAPAADAAAKAAVEKALKDRATGTPPPPVDMSRAPVAGDGGNGDERTNKYAELDNLDVDDLENRLAHMPEDQIDDYLASAPGGLLDNPRQA